MGNKWWQQFYTEVIQEAYTNEKKIKVVKMKLKDQEGEIQEFLLGYLYYLNGDYKNAESIFNKLSIKDKPYCLFANGDVMLGQAKRKFRDEADKAFDDYKRAIEFFKECLKDDDMMLYGTWGLACTYYEKAETSKFLNGEYKDNIVELYLNSKEKLDRIDNNISSFFPHFWNLKGDVYKQLRNYDKASVCYKNARKDALDYPSPINGLGKIMLKEGNTYKAIDRFKEALHIDKEFTYAQAYLGDSYYILGEYDKAIECFESILNKEGILEDTKQFKFNLDHCNISNWKAVTMSLYGVGKVYYELAKMGSKDYYNEALKYLDQTKKLSPGFSYAYLHAGRVLLKKYQLKDDVEISSIKKEFEDARKFFMHRNLTGRVFEIDNNYIKKIDFLNDINERFQKNESEVSREELVLFQTQHIETKAIANRKKYLLNFLSEDPYDDVDNEDNRDNSITLEVLRRWNSFTPLVSSTIGGGYYINLNGKGLVVDPGYNFVQIFRSSGHKFYEIDKIFVSHAHDDHTADLEPIMNLLYQYNKHLKEVFLSSKLARKYNISMKEINCIANKTENDIEDEERDIWIAIDKEYNNKKKRIEIFASQEVEMKFVGINSLINKSNNGLIQWQTIHGTKTIKMKNRINDIHINPIACKHRTYGDIYHDKAFGFFLNMNNEVSLVYTADMGWNDEMRKIYEGIKPKLLDRIVLIAHLGGFKDYEIEIDQSKNNKFESPPYYGNHLGRLGLIELNNILNPEICLISEFGEEFRGLRKHIADSFNNILENVVLPVDISFKINFSNNLEVWAINEINHFEKKIIYDYINYIDVEFDEINNGECLIYYRKGLKHSEVVDAIYNNYNRNCHLMLGLST